MRRVKIMCVVSRSLLLFCQRGNWWLFNSSWFCCRHPRRLRACLMCFLKQETGAVALRRKKFRLIDSRRAIFAFLWKHLTANCHMFGAFNTVEGDMLLSALAPTGCAVAAMKKRKLQLNKLHYAQTLKPTAPRNHQINPWKAWLILFGIFIC